MIATLPRQRRRLPRGALRGAARSEIGRVLRRLLSQTGQTEAQVADRAGVDRTYLIRLRQGTRYPSREVLAAIAGAVESSRSDRWRLVAAGGYLPVAWTDAHGWVSQVTEDPRLSADQRNRFEDLLEQICRLQLQVLTLREAAGEPPIPDQEVLDRGP